MVWTAARMVNAKPQTGQSIVDKNVDHLKVFDLGVDDTDCFESLKILSFSLVCVDTSMSRGIIQ